jgi:multisubunit Na+/H+ antiporter MnhC subunit
MKYIRENTTKGETMTEVNAKLLKAKKKAINNAALADFLKYADQAKRTHQKKLRSVQLPVKAHTSPLAKAFIITSFVTSTLTFGLVVAGVAHKFIQKKNDPQFNRQLEEVKDKAGDLVSKAKDKAEDLKGQVRNEAENKADVAADKAKEVSSEADTKVDEAKAQVKKTTR